MFVVGSLESLSQSSRNLVASTAEMYRLTGGGGQKSAVKVWAGLAPPEGWAEEPVPCLSPSCRGCWQFLVSIGL